MRPAQNLQQITDQMTDAMEQYAAVANDAVDRGIQIDPMLMATQNLLVATAVSVGDLIRLLNGE